MAFFLSRVSRRPCYNFYLSIFCLYVKVDPQISQVADFFDFGGGVEDSRFKTFRFFDSKRELFEKLASELKKMFDSDIPVTGT